MTKAKIRYLNTDLDIISIKDLTPLTQEMSRLGLRILSCVESKEFWYVTVETDKQYKAPENNITAILKVIEKLSPASIKIWKVCRTKEFNIGYDCGFEPWSFNQDLSANLLRRIAQERASLRITLYPLEAPTNEKSITIRPSSTKKKPKKN